MLMVETQIRLLFKEQNRSDLKDKSEWATLFAIPSAPFGPMNVWQHCLNFRIITAATIAPHQEKKFFYAICEQQRCRSV